MSAAGIYCGNIGLEAPRQLGKVERLGDDWKKTAARVIETKEIRGLDQMRLLAAEGNAVMNEARRVGGFSPCQWVLGRTPRYGTGEQGNDELAGQIGATQERLYPTTIFPERAMVGHEAKKAFVHSDSSARVGKALLREAAPKVDDSK